MSGLEFVGQRAPNELLAAKVSASATRIAELQQTMKNKRITIHAIRQTVSLIALFICMRLSADDELAGPKDFFRQHCETCHSGAKSKGDFDLKTLAGNFSDKKVRGLWLTVLDQLQTGQMPPEDKPRPPSDQVKALIDWISQSAVKAEAEHRATQGRVVMRRLNRAEYANTVRDLLGVEVDLADLLPHDTSISGFDNSAEALHTSSYLMRSYLDAADRVLDDAIANESEPWQIKKRFDIKQEGTVKATGSVYRHIDDGVAIFASWESANSASVNNLGHHDLSHHGKDPSKLEQLKIVEIETMKTLSSLLGKLKQSQEDGHSLLDRTTVFLGSNLGDGSSHSTRNLPVLLAGGGFQHGQHLPFDPKNPPPLCNLFVSMLQRLGLETDQFGTSTGTLTGLETI